MTIDGAAGSFVNELIGSRASKRATADEIVESLEWSLARLAALTGYRPRRSFLSLSCSLSFDRFNVQAAASTASSNTLAPPTPTPSSSCRRPPTAARLRAPFVASALLAPVLLPSRLSLRARLTLVCAVGVLKVRLMWPFPARQFVQVLEAVPSERQNTAHPAQALPATVRAIVVVECCSAAIYGKFRRTVAGES